MKRIVRSTESRKYITYINGSKADPNPQLIPHPELCHLNSGRLPMFITPSRDSTVDISPLVC